MWKTRGVVMNILQIGEHYKFGGAAKIEDELHKGLQIKGYKSFRIAGYNKELEKVDDKHHILYSKDWMVYVNELFNDLFGKYSIPNFYSFFSILYYIKKYKIDVLHFHAMQGNFLGIREMGWLSNIRPVVWTLHDTWAFTGGCMYFWSCENWKTGCLNCKNEDFGCKPKESHDKLKLKQKQICKRHIVFAVPSCWIGRFAKESILSKERIIHIANGINTEIFYPILSEKEEWRKKFKLPQTQHYILFIATNIQSKFKGFRHFCSALDNLEKPEDYTVLVVGDDKSKNAINKNCKVKYFGYIEEEKRLNEIYNMADLFILPSLQENFPTVALESMAAGTPVIGFETGGIPEQIDESVGWIVKEKTGKALANGIETAIENKELLKQKGKKARQWVLKQFDEKQMIDNYMKVYEKIRRKRKGESL